VAATAAGLRWAQVMAWRSARHHLDGRVPAKAMLDVVEDIAGLHAQVMSSAELTLAARVEGVAPDDVRRALWEERSLVKTWAMRGTLHLLPAAELPRWQAALSTRRGWEAGAWQRGFGVTLEELGRLNGAVAQALDGRLLTREELAAEVGRLTGSEELGDKLRESWGRCSSRPPPSACSVSLPTRASRSASPAPTPGWAAGPTTTPTRPWPR
jgi:Winged helix DNA-binding domain